MLTVVGTIPDPSVPLVCGPASYRGGMLYLERGGSYEVQRGTPALLAAACVTLARIGKPTPYAIVVGDEGSGKGSRLLYRYLVEHPELMESTVLVFHYLLPDVDWHGKVRASLETLPRQPLLVADAGFMYAAKMSGEASSYDLFTPDVGELAFLADDEAPHPFYTRGFLLHDEQRVPQLVERAYRYGNAAKHLLIKGSRDTIVVNGTIVAQVEHPSVPTMEAIGGTGDTLTGIVCALLTAGYAVTEAAQRAAVVNRLLGTMGETTVKTPITVLIDRIPRALERGESPSPQSS